MNRVCIGAHVARAKQCFSDQGHIAIPWDEDLATPRKIAEDIVMRSLLRDDLPVSHPDLRTFVHSGDGVGIASALAVAVRASRRSWEEHFVRAGITPDERRMLRYVLQRPLRFTCLPR